MRSTSISLRVSDDELARIDAYAAARFGGNRTQAIIHAVDVAAGSPRWSGVPIEAEAWATLAADARRRLRRMLTEAELAVCLRATRSWLVTGADAHMIHDEVADMDIEATVGPGDPVFGDGPALDQPVDTRALAARLAAMPDFDRAVLTLACRDWWAAEPRGPLTAVLGGPMRGAGGMN